MHSTVAKVTKIFINAVLVVNNELQRFHFLLVWVLVYPPFYVG
jgi:hypothetical protein